jgi:S1-C subfamily serine protease
VRRAALGLTWQREAVPRRFARAHGLEQATGVLVAAVQPGGPAARAGIEAGDLLLTAGGEAMTGVDSLLRWLTGERVGVAAEVTLLRRGDVRRLTVVPAERSL